MSSYVPWRCRGLRPPGTLTVGGEAPPVVSPRGGHDNAKECHTRLKITILDVKNLFFRGQRPNG
eukprot:6965109-Pyramimonas_sp.AAC.2